MPKYEPMTHELKTWPEYFAAVVSGKKNFEVRKDDRGFCVGDRLLLQEYDKDTEAYTGASVERHVSYILPGGSFGIEPGFCVLGFPKNSQ